MKDDRSLGQILDDEIKKTRRERMERRHRTFLSYPVFWGAFVASLVSTYIFDYAALGWALLVGGTLLAAIQKCEERIEALEDELYRR